MLGCVYVEKYVFLALGIAKRGLQVCIGKWKRPSEQVAWGEENLAITQCIFVMENVIFVSPVT
jgi:hypothetical protein